MAYSGIDKKRFEWLLLFGVDDGELRRFFKETQKPLIMGGAKVQILPKGPKRAIKMMSNFPPSLDATMQKWFSKNLTIDDLEDVDELIELFSLYEEEGVDEKLSPDEAKKLSRSCLIHLFSSAPPQKLIEFLSSPIGSSRNENFSGKSDKNKTEHSEALEKASIPSASFVQSIIALLDGEDPSIYFSDLSPQISSLVTGLHAFKAGNREEGQAIIEHIADFDHIKPILFDYAKRLADTARPSHAASSGITLIEFEEVDTFEFDLDSDKIFGRCKRDTPETAVFIQPLAIQTSSGKWVSLEKQGDREKLFPKTGDIQAYSGANYPRQPTFGELGIWGVSQKEGHDFFDRPNNFLLKTRKTDVYEVLSVPFVSDDYDSVRNFIKQQFSDPEKRQLIPYLFLLKDDLIVGYPSNRDLSRDEGFDEALHSWKHLTAFRFDARVFVPGPLPAHELYECATLASTLRKFLSNRGNDHEKLSRAQQRFLLDSINSGELRLNAIRQVRLLEKLGNLDQVSIDVLLDEVLKHEKIGDRIEQLIREKVDEQTDEKNVLAQEIKLLEGQRDSLRDGIARQKIEQRTLPASIAKAARDAIQKSQGDMIETLGQVMLFRALMGSQEDGGREMDSVPDSTSFEHFRERDHDPTPFQEILRSFGIPNRHARAIELTGDAVFSAGMVLTVEGVAARLVSEAWGKKYEDGCLLMDCGIGLTTGKTIEGISEDETRSIVILDANFSALDAYARRLIDQVQHRIANDKLSRLPRIVMSLSDDIVSLPLPSRVDAISIRISLDDEFRPVRVDQVEGMLEGAGDEDAEIWASKLWNPALKSFLKSLRNMEEEDAALVLSVLSAKSQLTN